MYSINLLDILGNNYVSLSEMLDARENRALEQRKILDEFNITIISFTLNISGPVKTFPLAQKSFIEGKKLVNEKLKRHNLNIAYEKYNIDKTSYEAFFALDYNPFYIKKLMVDIENSCPLGRIFDIDVLKANGDKLSRQDLNIPERTCLLCNDKAHVCARSKKHTTDELMILGTVLFV